MYNRNFVHDKVCYICKASTRWWKHAERHHCRECSKTVCSLHFNNNLCTICTKHLESRLYLQRVGRGLLSRKAITDSQEWFLKPLLNKKKSGTSEWIKVLFSLQGLPAPFLEEFKLIINNMFLEPSGSHSRDQLKILLNQKLLELRELFNFNLPNKQIFAILSMYCHNSTFERSENSDLLLKNMGIKRRVEVVIQKSIVTYFRQHGFLNSELYHILNTYEFSSSEVKESHKRLTWTNEYYSPKFSDSVIKFNSGPFTCLKIINDFPKTRSSIYIVSKYINIYKYGDYEKAFRMINSFCTSIGIETRFISRDSFGFYRISCQSMGNAASYRISYGLQSCYFYRKIFDYSCASNFVLDYPFQKIFSDSWTAVPNDTLNEDQNKSVYVYLEFLINYSKVLYNKINYLVNESTNENTKKFYLSYLYKRKIKINYLHRVSKEYFKFRNFFLEGLELYIIFDKIINRIINTIESFSEHIPVLLGELTHFSRYGKDFEFESLDTDLKIVYRTYLSHSALQCASFILKTLPKIFGTNFEYFIDEFSYYENKELRYEDVEIFSHWKKNTNFIKKENIRGYFLLLDIPEIVRFNSREWISDSNTRLANFNGKPLHLICDVTKFAFDIPLAVLIPQVEEIVHQLGASIEYLIIVIASVKYRVLGLDKYQHGTIIVRFPHTSGIYQTLKEEFDKLEEFENQYPLTTMIRDTSEEMLYQQWIELQKYTAVEQESHFDITFSDLTRPICTNR